MTKVPIFPINKFANYVTCEMDTFIVGNAIKKLVDFIWIVDLNRNRMRRFERIDSKGEMYFISGALFDHTETWLDL